MPRITLIELVAVIVILGSLASVALPAFLDLRKDAWNAKLMGAGGAFASALQNARAVCRMMGASGAPTYNLPQTGGALDFDANCYPMGTNWVAGQPTDANCQEVMSVMLPQTRVATGAGATVDFRAFSVAAPNEQCAYFAHRPDGTRVATGLTGWAAVLSFYFDGTNGIYIRDMDDNAIWLVSTW